MRSERSFMLFVVLLASMPLVGASRAWAAPEVTLWVGVAPYDGGGEFCATENFAVVPANHAVMLCYNLENTGDVVLDRHTLLDSELGLVLQDFVYGLSPGSTVFLTQITNVSEVTQFFAVWTAAGGPGQSAAAFASAVVLIPGPAPTGAGLAAVATLAAMSRRCGNRLDRARIG